MQINITIKSLPTEDIIALGKTWKNLESRSECSVFLSWQWIFHWLTIINEQIIRNNVYIIQAWHDEKIVGLGVFVEKQRKVFGIIPITQWWLHRCGQQDKDQIWIEYNDFLLDSSSAHIVRNEMIRFLVQHQQNVQEFIVGLSDTVVNSSFKKHFNYSRDLIDSVGHLVNFNKISSKYSETVLSKNTRYQIKRSKKLLEQQGPLHFRIIVDSNEIKELLPNISKSHQKRWQHTPEGSGFSNDFFTSFHQRIIAADDCVVHLAVLSLESAGQKKDIGYLINFVYCTKVNFYLSAFDQSFDDKIKIGLVLHQHAIEHYHQLNYQTYDFLAGDAQYKRSLTNQSYEMNLACFFQSKLLWLEKKSRQLKSSILTLINS